jgi:hypothetical protein
VGRPEGGSTRRRTPGGFPHGGRGGVPQRVPPVGAPVVVQKGVVPQGSPAGMVHKGGPPGGYQMVVTSGVFPRWSPMWVTGASRKGGPPGGSPRMSTRWVNRMIPRGGP